MANPNQPVQTCILKVDLKCCTGCQKKASEKLKSISGVKEVEYNSIKGLMKVTGDVDYEVLDRKLTKCGRKTEVCSVKFQLDDDDDDDDSNTDNDDDTEEEDTFYETTSSGPGLKTMKPEIQEKMMKKKKNIGLPKRRSLFGCLTHKSKVVQPLPMPKRNLHLNGPFANALASSQFRHPHPRMPFPPPPYPPMMFQQPQGGYPMPWNTNMPYPPRPYQPMMLQQPQGGYPMPCNPNMYPQPYFTNQMVKVNPKLHYN